MQKPLAANVHNPHEQSKDELIEGFVVRQKLFRQLFEDIKSSNMTYPEPHYLIEGQRGMGKTTLLLRLNYEIENDHELNTWLIPVVLKEEAYYGITRLFELWKTVAQALEAKDEVFSGIADRMKQAYHDQTDYDRICFEILKESLKRHSKKLIIFIDNFGEMVKNFSDKESHRFREILMNCPYLRIIGATSVVLEAFFTYTHAFYEFFKTKRLEGLDREETHILLLELARLSNQEDTIRSIIEQHPGRVESLRILTGGVIRTIVLLFDIFIDNVNGNALSDLEYVLDRVTTLYKHRMDELTAMQRKVVNVIALHWDAINSEDIAREVYLDTVNVTPILSELEKVFIIQRVATATQLNLYRLQERFFNIWYLMRIAPEGSQNKVIWLVRFLECWYDPEALCQRARQHIEAIATGSYHPKAAYYLTEALSGTVKLDMDTEYELIRATKKYLQETEQDLAAELSPADKELFEKGIEYYWNQEYEKAINLFLQIKNKNEQVNFGLGYSFTKLKDFEKAEKYYLSAVEKEHAIAMNNLGYLYESKFKDYKKAEKYYLMAIEKGYINAKANIGRLYHYELDDFEKAEKYYLMAIAEGHLNVINNLGDLYKYNLKDYEKAEKYYLMAVRKRQVHSMLLQMPLIGLKIVKDKISPQKGHVGKIVLKTIKYYLKILRKYLIAVKRGETNPVVSFKKLFQYQFRDFKKGIQYVKSLKARRIEVMISLGSLYKNDLKNQDKAKRYYEKAERYYLRAIKKGDVDAMFQLGYLYYDLEEYEKAEKYYLMAVEKENSPAMGWLGFLYHYDLKEYEKAEKYYLMALEKEEWYAAYGLAELYFEQKTKKQEALQYALQSVEKNRTAYRMHTLACIYVWCHQYENAAQMAKEFMYDEEIYEEFEEEDIIQYLMLLLAKHQYPYVREYFEDPRLNLQERFKPLYYAFLHFTGDETYYQLPPELSEPVNDIIKQVRQMEKDYA